MSSFSHQSFPLTSSANWFFSSHKTFLSGNLVKIALKYCSNWTLDCLRIKSHWIRCVDLLVPANYLVTKADLVPFLSARKTTTAESAPQFDLSQLQRLHTILDLVILLQTYLSPSQECLREIVHQALQELASFQPDVRKRKAKDFEFNIQIGHVKEKMERWEEEDRQTFIYTAR